MFLWVNRIGHMEQAYGFSPVWARSCTVASLWYLNCLGQKEQEMAASLVVWTRSCCASLAGLRNRFWQCPQKCTIALGVAEVETAAVDGTSDALLEAIPIPSSNCGEGMDTAIAIAAISDSVAIATAAAFPVFRLVRGPHASGNDRLRVCCFGFGGDLPSDSIANVSVMSH